MAAPRMTQAVASACIPLIQLRNAHGQQTFTLGANEHCPRDGSLIVALHKDKRGASLLRWGDPEALPNGKWSSADWSRHMRTDADYEGWIAADPLPEDD